MQPLIKKDGDARHGLDRAELKDFERTSGRGQFARLVQSPIESSGA